MDCFASLAMTETVADSFFKQPKSSRGADRARGVAVWRSSEKQRAQGRPGARCTRGLVCKLHKESAHEHTGSAEAIRPSLRSGFTAYFVLSPVTGFLATVACANLFAHT
jgi:hypothetical protein